VTESSKLEVKKADVQYLQFLFGVHAHLFYMKVGEIGDWGLGPSSSLTSASVESSLHDFYGLYSIVAHVLKLYLTTKNTSK
jgi:hypothetical protein